MIPTEVGQALSTGAVALRERFTVLGRFSEGLLDGQAVSMRSHLELIDTAAPASACAAAARRDGPADLVAVMMNPGGSRPLESLGAAGWALTMPDRTQYQLMRLALAAQAMGWPLRHIRVLNLSDLRTPKSAELFQRLATLRDDRHSIFSPLRRDELAASLGPAAVPVLRAWGLSPALAGLAQPALQATAGRRVLGLGVGPEPGVTAYRHPLPQRADLQQRWLLELLPQLVRRPGGAQVS